MPYNELLGNQIDRFMFCVNLCVLGDQNDVQDYIVNSYTYTSGTHAQDRTQRIENKYLHLYTDVHLQYLYIAYCLLPVTCCLLPAVAVVLARLHELW